MRCLGTSGLKICGEPLRGWMCRIKTCSLSLRYGEKLTMEEIGQIYGISRMAASKRLKKLYQKLEDSVL